MKKLGFTFFCLLTLLTFSFNTAFATPLTDGYLTLREVRNDPGGNVIFIFDVTGDFSKSDFRDGSVFMGDQQFNLGCNKVDDFTVQCTTSRATAGQSVRISLTGFTFWANVPEGTLVNTSESSSQPSQYCYNVYDLNYSLGGPPFIWDDFADHCQSIPANYGEVVAVFNPNFNATYNYHFMSANPSCGSTNSITEDAYFYPC